MTECIKLIVVTGLLLLVSPFLRAQQQLNSDGFILKTSQQLNLAGQLTGQAIHFPWIEEIDFRTQTDDFNLRQQEYTVRLAPTTPRIRKAQQSLLAHYYSEPDKDVVSSKLKESLTLYTDWLSLYFLNQEGKLISELELIQSDKKKVYSRLIGNYDIDFKDLVDLEIDNTKLKEEQYKTKLESDQLKEMYGVSGYGFDYSDLITLEQIRLQVTALETTINEPNAEYLYAQEGIRKEIELEEAEGNKVFDFLQLRYNSDPQDIFKEKFSVGLGFELSNSGNRKLKIAELKLEEMNDSRNLELDQMAASMTLDKMKSDLLRIISLAEYFETLRVEEETKLNHLVDLMQREQEFDPILVLSVKSQIISSKLKALKYYEDVYFDYIKLLARTRQLISTPFRNYLKA